MRHSRRLLVTGGAGFIGSNLVRYWLARYPEDLVVNLDKLTYAGRLSNLAGIDSLSRHVFVHGDVCDPVQVDHLFRKYRIDGVVHLAAESHVDRSIVEPLRFVRTNVEGTAVLLEAARYHWDSRRDARFHHVSTDEVFGELGEVGAFQEGTPYDPSSPYSASKAASDHLVRAYHRTYGLDAVITNCSNNYGPYQHPEKLVPLMIHNALAGEPLPVYGDGSNVRDWLFVEDHCRAIDRVFHDGRAGSTYNVGGRSERTNLDVVETICDVLEEVAPRLAPAYRSLIRFVPDRPGHDFRYAIDTTRIETELGWSPHEGFETGLRRTIAWYLENADPSRTVDDAAFEAWKGANYGAR